MFVPCRKIQHPHPRRNKKHNQSIHPSRLFQGPPHASPAAVEQAETPHPLSMRPQAPWMNHAGFFPKASWLTFSKWSCNLDTMLIYVIGPPHPHMLTIWMIRVWGGWLNWVMSSASLVIKHHPGVEFHPRWILHTTRSQVKCDHMWQEKHSLQMMEDYFVFYSKQLLSSKTSVAELLVCESFWNKITKTQCSVEVGTIFRLLL